MPSLSALVVLAVAAFSLASATPLKRQASQCNPNFEGTAVSIVTSLNEEWYGQGPAIPGTVIGIQPYDGTANYHLEFSGSSSPSYLIKDVRATSNDIVVAFNPNANPPSPILTLATLATGDSSQLFNVQCDWCSDEIDGVHGTVATGCTISQGGKCAQWLKESQLVFMEDCAVSDVQTFSFVTV